LLHVQGRWTGGGHVFFAKYNFNFICSTIDVIYFHLKNILFSI